MSRTNSRYRQDFGPFDDDYRGFEPGADSARGPLILALAIGVMLIFSAVIWNTYSQGVRSDSGALPIVLADSSPYKRVPDNPGGSAAPDLDRRIYDQLDGSERTEPDFETGGVQDEFDVSRVLQGGPPIELRPGQETEIDEVTGIPLAVLPQIEAIERDPGISEESLPEPPRPVVSEPAPVATPPIASRFETDGEFLVQVSALRSQEAADAAWANLVGDAPGLLSGAQKRVQRADLGAKGVFYRLRVGAFGDRAAASVFCDELKARGRDCIVVTG